MPADARDNGDLPRHVAIIMDGNGRWATRRGLPRLKGHHAGAESVRQVVRAAGELGLEVLTLYSFSTENWRRPRLEVEGLMALLERYLRERARELDDNDVQLRAIGDLERLPRRVRKLLDEVIHLTRGNQGLKLVLALSYGSRTEIVGACRELARAVARGELRPDDIDDHAVASRLYTAGLPDPDLLIRTSGELRLSNFLLWQLAYTELLVVDEMWPDFRRPHLEQALSAYAGRQRRFGRTGLQLEGAS